MNEKIKRVRGQCAHCLGPTSMKNVLCRECRTKATNRGRTREEAARERNLMYKYGIDLGGLQCLWEAFRGRCGICDIELQHRVGRQHKPRLLVCRS